MGKLRYFKDGPNIFDFFLVVLGIIGIIIELLEGEVGEIGSAEARLIRISRVFLVLRFLRVFRLFHAKLNKEKEVSITLAQHMKKITILISFARAHLTAQSQLVKYFGGNGKIDEKDEAMLARCVLQSQTSVYRALSLAVSEERKMNQSVLKELLHVIERKNILEDLESFIMAAHHDGALSARQAESMLHPMNAHLNRELRAIHEITEGIVSRSSHSLGEMQRKVPDHSQPSESKDPLRESADEKRDDPAAVSEVPPAEAAHGENESRSTPADAVPEPIVAIP